MNLHKPLLLILILAVLLAPAAASSAQPAPQPSGPGLFRIYFHSQAELQQAADRLDVWEVHKAEGWLLAYLTPEQAQSVRQSGLRLEVDAAAAAEKLQPRVFSPDQLSGIPGFACYRTVEETQTALAGLVASYPALASSSVIGESWTKVSTAGAAGYDLSVLKLTNSAIPGPKPILFLMAEIHAREYTTAETALRFGEYLLQNYPSDPDIAWLLDYNEIDILPMSNPDGRKQAEQGLSWRKNLNNTLNCPYVVEASQDGVDLNRNSSFGWGGPGASNYPCDMTYRGSAAASEPETQALQDYITSIFPDRRGPNRGDAAPLDYQGLFITLHSYGPYDLWPYGDTGTPPPNNIQLQTLGRKFAYYNNGYPGQSSVALYSTSGATDDFAYGTLGVPAYTFEMGTNFFQDCSTYLNSIWPNNRDALKYALKAARAPYQAPAGPELTNQRLQSATVSAGTNIILLATAADNRYSAANGSEASQNIQAARFSIDLPSWAPGAVLNPMTANDGTFNSVSEAIRGTYDTSGMTPGRHIIFLEAQDAAGNWGVPSAVYLTVLETFSLEAAPAQSSKSSPVGTSATYTITVTNKGNIPDSYTVSALSTPTWDTQLSSESTGTLAPGEASQVTVTVQIPPAPAPTKATTVFTARSNGLITLKKTANLQTQALWMQFMPITALSQ